MALILLLIIVALVLGIIGVVAEGLAYLLFIGSFVLVAALVLAALLWRRTGRRPAR